MEFLKIKYRNSCDLGGSVFSAPSNGFQYTIFLPVNIGQGTYELKEEGREDGEGNFIRSFGRLQRDYQFSLIVPEYTYDALANIQLHNSIFITTRYDENSKAYNFKVSSPEWLKNGSVCKVQINFTVDYLITTGCCQNEALTYKPCVTCDSRIEIQGWISDKDPIFVNKKSDLVDCYGYYIVGSLVNGELINNILYQYDTATDSWYALTDKYVLAADAVCWVDRGIHYYFYRNGNYWYQYLALKSLTESSGIITVKGLCLSDTFVQLQISTDGATWTNTGQVTDCNIFSSYGIKISGLTSGVNYYFRFRMFNNNCNYGYSDFMTIVKA